MWQKATVFAFFLFVAIGAVPVDGGRKSRLRSHLLPALVAQRLSAERGGQSVTTWFARILLSCLFFLPVSIASSQMKLPEGTSVLEVAVNDQLLALTKEQIPKLIKSATADDIQAECVLGI